MLKTKIEKIQKYLKENKLPGWLLYDFRGSNTIAVDVIGLKGIQTRRWFYFIPSEGQPQGLVHSIEQANFKNLPGKFQVYVGYKELKEKLAQILKGEKQVLMEYSAENAIPYISRVDAGTIELVKSLGVKISSSADLVQYFQARWDKEQYQSHKKAALSLMEIKTKTFNYIKQKIDRNQKLTEYDLQQYIWNLYPKYNLEADYPPICAVNENAGNPHYEPTREVHKEVKKGDLVLIDLWAKEKKPNSIYADITWVGFIGEKVPEKYENIFQIVREARDKAVNFLKENWGKKDVYGWQVDNVARGFITQKGYGKYFTHRTGHSIGQMVHGNGVNIDNLETKDNRKIIPSVGFSIEPGIYLKDFGIRSEIDVYAGENGIEVTTLPLQKTIIPILFREK